MRPHRLTLTAFGPFAEEVTVDFDRMTAGGLFLLVMRAGPASRTT